MSDELADEIEAINSIYGADTLRRADGDGADEGSASGVGSVHVLRLPGGASWLRLRFPAAYPREPPAVLGTQRSSGGVRGAGARDAALFAEALGGVFASGAVCVFDAVEAFAARAATVKDGGGREEEGDGRHGRPEVELQQQPSSATDLEYAPPVWIASEPVTENKSTFIAHVTRATSPAQARTHIAHLLGADRRLRTATHNMTAWRVRAAGCGVHDCDNDGESAAGARLLHLMHLMGVWDAVVVVSRWYGGVKLGPRRFAVINAVARHAFVRAGLVAEREGGKEQRGRKAR